MGTKRDTPEFLGVQASPLLLAMAARGQCIRIWDRRVVVAESLQMLMGQGVSRLLRVRWYPARASSWTDHAKSLFASSSASGKKGLVLAKFGLCYKLTEGGWTHYGLKWYSEYLCC